MNSGSSDPAASIAIRLTMRCPFSPQAAAEEGSRNRTSSVFNSLGIAANYNLCMVVSISGVTIETQKGNISLASTDAIVNAANDHLWMGSGVAGAIKRTGGLEIER